MENSAAASADSPAERAVSPDDATRMLRQLETDRRNIPNGWPIFRASFACMSVAITALLLMNAATSSRPVFWWLCAIGAILMIITLLSTIPRISKVARQNPPTVKEWLNTRAIAALIVWILLIGCAPLLKPPFVDSPWWMWLVIAPLLGCGFFFIVRWMITTPGKGLAK